MIDAFADPANITDSPDLGPPPVAHFEEGDPIKFDPTENRSQSDGATESTGEVQPKLSANLETRKKRRESSHRGDGDVRKGNRDSDRGTASTAIGMPASQPVKSGAKRKLNVCDDDDQAARVDEPETQDTQLNHRNSDSRLNDHSKTDPIISGATEAIVIKAPPAAAPSIFVKASKEKVSGASATVTANGRKALGPSKCCKECGIGKILTVTQRV